MRDVNDNAGAPHDKLNVSRTKTVRFSALVASAGRPEVYLPLSDPKKDRTFMRAVKEHRVLSIRQEPTSTRTDFGIVGFDEKKHTTLLVFPRSLTQFRNVRVIGIKYDILGESRLAASKAPRVSKRPEAVQKPPRDVTPTQRVLRSKLKGTKRPKPQRIEPQPKEFRVRLRITIVSEKEVTVQAMTKAQAKKEAVESVEMDGAVKAVSLVEVA